MRVLLRRLDRDDERGAVAIMTALLLVVLLVAAAFAVDAGNAYAQNRQLSVAADAAALAAAAKVGEQLPPGDACTSAFAASQSGLATQVANDLNTANNRANGPGDSEPVDSVTVTCDGRAPETFDQIVIATHSDQALSMLLDPSHVERQILRAVKYQPNRVVLHRDVRLMPKNRKVWASWNYLRNSNDAADSDVSLTYWMNRLQGIDPKHPLFVSLNPQTEPDPALVVGEWSFSHPVCDQAAIEAQSRLKRVNGLNRTWLAGAWTGYGFHEDGLRSGLEVAANLNAPAPFMVEAAHRAIEMAGSLPIAAE